MNTPRKEYDSAKHAELPEYQPFTASRSDFEDCISSGGDFFVWHHEPIADVNAEWYIQVYLTKSMIWQSANKGCFKPIYNGPHLSREAFTHLLGEFGINA